MANSKCFVLIVLSSPWLIPEIQATHNPKHTPTWYEGPTVGWSWYKDFPLKDKPKKKEEEKRFQTATSDYVYTQQMEKVRKDFEELQAKAILNPTLENVEKLQKAQANIMNRSTAFEKAWMMASLLSPTNYRESDQASPLHRKIYQQKAEDQLDQDIRSLVKTYGLFFIFKHDCPYCHEMAPIVKQLRDRYGFAIKAISPEGLPLQDFPDAVKDNGTIRQINPEGIFPIVFLANPHTGQTITLARGLTSPSELTENFKVIIQYFKDQVHVR